MPEALAYMSAGELARRVRERELSPLEMVDHFLERIERWNPSLNAYVTVLHEEARRAAKEAERAVMSGRPLGPLHGVPVAIKDLFDFKAGVRNTFGCAPFRQFVPEQSSTYVERLERAGAIMLGKTNTAEMGHKGLTDNRLWGPTGTPFDPHCNAGGSSGGSAAAVAAGLTTLGQGSDAGGSIRIPAAMCAVYGLKPSFGRVAAVARPDGFLSHTPFIHAGPLTRSVEDAALMLNVMAGPHPRDPFGLPAAGVDYVAATRRDVTGLKAAYSPNFGGFPVEPAVTAIVRDAAAAMESAGVEVEEISMEFGRPHSEITDLWLREMSVLYAALAEHFKTAGIDLLGEHRSQLCRNFVELIDRGRRVGAAEYKTWDAARTEVLDAIEDILESHDLLLTPTLGVAAVKNADQGQTLGPAEVNGEPVERTIGWCLTHPVNFTGHPAASIPAGFTEAGLPVGMQIIGRRFADDTVLAASAAFERVRPWAMAYDRLEPTSRISP